MSRASILSNIDVMSSIGGLSSIVGMGSLYGVGSIHDMSNIDGMSIEGMGSIFGSLSALPAPYPSILELRRTAEQSGQIVEHHTNAGIIESKGKGNTAMF